MDPDWGGVIYAADYTGSDVEATADTYYTLRSTTLVPGDYLVNAYVVPKENKNGNLNVQLDDYTIRMTKVSSIGCNLTKRLKVTDSNYALRLRVYSFSNALKLDFVLSIIRLL